MKSERTLNSAEIKSLSKETKATQQEFNALQKSLELKFDSKTFEEAQRLAQKAVDETNQRAAALQERMKLLEQAGQIDTAEYAKLQRQFNFATADAAKLEAQVKKLNDLPLMTLQNEARKSAAAFSELQKELELKFDPKKFEQAQKAAQQAVDDTSKKAEALQERLRTLEKSGKMDTEEYRDVQKELLAAEKEAKSLEQQIKKLNDLPLKNLQEQVGKVADGFDKAGKAMKPISALAGGAIAGLGALGKKAISTADDIATLATQYDMSAESLQKFNYVALQTDTQSEDLYKGFVKVRAAVADIATGTTSAASAALRSLNLDLNSFDGSDKRFTQYSTPCLSWKIRHRWLRSQ